MKVILVCFLAFVGAFGLPQNQLGDNYSWEEDKYAISNSIDDDVSYVSNRKPGVEPSLSIPLYVYREMMGMKPHQMRSVAGVLRAIIKPILTSVEFQVLTEFVDESLRLFKDDPNMKAMVRDGINSLQHIYQGADGKMARQFLTWMISEYSDEETARSFSSLVSDISPTLENWVLEPMKKYYRSYVTPTLASLVHVVNSFFGEDLASNEIARSSGRWSDIVDLYIERLSDMTSEAKSILQNTAKFLQIQDADYVGTF